MTAVPKNSPAAAGRSGPHALGRTGQGLSEAGRARIREEIRQDLRAYRDYVERFGDPVEMARRDFFGFEGSQTDEDDPAI